MRATRLSINAEILFLVGLLTVPDILLAADGLKNA